MKKIMNAPGQFVREMLEGILLAHPQSLRSVDDNLQCLVRAGQPTAGKVALATGGGSGHLPVFLGYVGEGLLDGVSVGKVFASPGAGQMLAVTKAIEAGAGVLYIYGNYGGDVMNFELAAELAAAEDIRVAQVVVADDVASAPKGSESKRRGVAGLFYAYKIAGAKASQLASLAEVQRVAMKATHNTRSMGVALSPCILPEVGKPTFALGEDQMEIGMGIHGEPGISRGQLATADDIVADMLPRIIEDLPYRRGDEVSVLVNGLGATPKEELYIIYRQVARLLSEAGIRIHRPYIGEFATSLEMAGMSLTLLKLDQELKALLDAPAHSPFFEQSH